MYSLLHHQMLPSLVNQGSLPCEKRAYPRVTLCRLYAKTYLFEHFTKLHIAESFCVLGDLCHCFLVVFDESLTATLFRMASCHISRFRRQRWKNCLLLHLLFKRIVHLLSSRLRSSWVHNNLVWWNVPLFAIVRCTLFLRSFRNRTIFLRVVKPINKLVGLFAACRFFVLLELIVLDILLLFLSDFPLPLQRSLFLLLVALLVLVKLTKAAWRGTSHRVQFWLECTFLCIGLNAYCQWLLALLPGPASAAFADCSCGGSKHAGWSHGWSSFQNDWDYSDWTVGRLGWWVG